MAEKYDGWVVISFYTKTPTLLPWTFSLTRKGAIQNWGIGWEKGRKAGWQKVVKVKLVEVK